MLEVASILDIGSGKVACLIGVRGPNNTISVKGFSEKEYAGFFGRAFLSTASLTAAIREALTEASKSARVEPQNLCVGVPGEFSVSLTNKERISFTKRRKITLEDIDELHKQGDKFSDIEGYKVIESQPIYYTIENERRVVVPTGLVSNGIGGLISYTLADKYFLDTLKEALTDAGIESYYFASSLVAQSMFLFDGAVRDRYVVLITVGKFTTTVALARGDGILVSYNIPLGGDLISRCLEEEFKISSFHAEALKRKVSLNLAVTEKDEYRIPVNRIDTKRFNAQKVNQVVLQGVKLIANTVKKALKESPHDFPDYIPYHITGGGLLTIKGAVDFLSKYLLRNIEIAATRLPMMQRPDLTRAFGLIDMALSAN